MFRIDKRIYSLHNGNMTTTTAPTKPGQIVRNINGTIGITTDEPRKRSPQIPVMYVGAFYPVLAQIDELSVMDASTLSA